MFCLFCMKLLQSFTILCQLSLAVTVRGAESGRRRSILNRNNGCVCLSMSSFISAIISCRDQGQLTTLIFSSVYQVPLRPMALEGRTFTILQICCHNHPSAETSSCRSDVVDGRQPWGENLSLSWNVSGRINPRMNFHKEISFCSVSVLCHRVF